MLDGARCRAIREDQALTLQELADMVSESLGAPVSESTICKWELGRRQPTPKRFRALCEALNVAKEDLLVAQKVEAA